jgi:putative peptidoglycan lipid II flippase
MQTSVQTTVAGTVRSAAVITVITVLARAFSFGREIAAAAAFGVSADFDVFFIAFLVPSFFIFAIVACTGPAMIPVLMMARLKGGDEALRAIVARANGVGLVGFCGVGLLAALGSPVYLPLLAAHVTAEQMVLAQQWALLLCLLIPLCGLAAVWTAIANAQGSLALPAGVPMLTPLVTILMLNVFAEPYGAWALVAGALLGVLLELVLLGILLQRRRLLVVPRLRSTPQRGFEGAFAMLFVGAAILGLIPTADQAMAATIGPGAITGIIFGGRLVSLTGSIGALALGTAVLPAFTALAAQLDWAALRGLLRRCVGLTLLLTVPTSVLVAWLSLPIVEIAFQRGQFTSDDAQLVATVQAFYILQTPTYLGWIVLARVLAAMRRTFLLLVLSAMAAALNVGLNFHFMQAYGVAGIALATALVFCLLFLATLAATHYCLPAHTPEWKS